MPEQPQSGMNIAPDGTVYEILDDGTIKRIGKVSPDGSFEPFGGPKDGIRVRDGIIYRVINGKEVKIGRILPNGEIETINQKIKSETEAARSKVKIVTIVCCLIAFLAVLYVFNSQQQAKVKTAEINARQTEAVAKIAEEERKAEQAKAEAQKAEEERKKQEEGAKEIRKTSQLSFDKSGDLSFLTINSMPWANIYIDGKLIGSTPIVKHKLPAGNYKIQFKNPKAGIDKTIPVELRPGEQKRLIEKFDGEENATPALKEKKAVKATMSEQEAKKLYMEARMMRDEDPEKAKKKLQEIINSVDSESKYYKKAKELLDKI